MKIKDVPESNPAKVMTLAQNPKKEIESSKGVGREAEKDYGDLIKLNSIFFPVRQKQEKRRKKKRKKRNGALDLD